MLTVTAGSSPPVVFVAQLGIGGDSWGPLLDLLTTGSTTFTYDRPGTGDEPPRPAPNPPLSYGEFARELGDLLDAEGVTEPAVVVGHSFGGLIARAYAIRRPDRVAGLVCVDGSIPQFNLRPSAEPQLDGDDPDATEIDIVAGQVEILSAGLPRVPAVVMTRKRGWWTGEFETVPRQALDDLWFVHQQLLARELGAPLIIADAGHQIPAERPELVAYLIDRVVDAARRGQAVDIDPDQLKALGAHLDPESGS